MDGIQQRLTDHTIIGVDTSIFIYQVEENLRYLPVTRTVLATVQAGQVEAVTSVITVMELTVHPWRRGQAEVAQQYEALLIHFPHLQVADVSRDIARRAAQLRANHNLRPADALHIATTLHHGGTAFVSNDSQLRRLASMLDVVILDDYVQD